MKKKKKWVRHRHRVVTRLLQIFLAPIVKHKYHIKIDRFTEQGERNWLILANHQTDFDQFFVGMAFKKQVYYLAMEDIFSMGFVSRAIEWLVAPIPIIKATNDVKSVMNCMRVAKEGGTIAIFPEGNRTYSGKTCYIKPAVAALAQKLGLPIAIFKIEGGYGIKPRWANKGRKGQMKAGVTRIIEPEEYKAMSKDELYELICNELWVDETAIDGLYEGKDIAEGLEKVIYVCPECGLSEFVTKGDIITCSKCGRAYRHLPDKQLQALSGNTDFKYVADWYDYQENFIRNMDMSVYDGKPIYQDRAEVLRVIVYKNKKRLDKSALITMYSDRVEINGKQLMYDDITAMACVAGHKLNIFHKDGIFQLKGNESFNALKYCNIYYHAKFIKEDHHDGEFQFLGL